jgi:hypothetical protein
MHILNNVQYLQSVSTHNPVCKEMTYREIYLRDQCTMLTF